MRIQTDGKYAIIPSDGTTALRIPIPYLGTVRQAVEQTCETGNHNYMEKGDIGIETKRHRMDRNCNYCDEQRKYMIDIVVGVDYRSKSWKYIHNSVLWCKPCARVLVETIEHEFETNPDKYLGYTL